MWRSPAKQRRLRPLERQANHRTLTYSSAEFGNGAIASHNALTPAAFLAVLVDLEKVFLWVF